jgi:hypothetical protein
MYATRYVFSRGFFKGWIIVVFLWAFYASSIITLLPVWEGPSQHRGVFLFRFSCSFENKREEERK